MADINIPETVLPEKVFYWNFVNFQPNMLAMAEDLMELQNRLNDAITEIALEANARQQQITTALVAFRNSLRQEVNDTIDNRLAQIQGLLITNAFRQYIQSGDGNDDNGQQLGGGGETVHKRVLFSVPSGMTFFVTRWALSVVVYGRYSVGTPYMSYSLNPLTSGGGGQNPPDNSAESETGSYANPVKRIDGPALCEAVVAVDRCGSHFSFLAEGYLVSTDSADYFGFGVSPL